jgi:hypothetical protein
MKYAYSPFQSGLYIIFGAYNIYPKLWMPINIFRVQLFFKKEI